MGVAAKSTVQSAGMRKSEVSSQEEGSESLRSGRGRLLNMQVSRLAQEKVPRLQGGGSEQAPERTAQAQPPSGRLGPRPRSGGRGRGHPPPSDSQQHVPGGRPTARSGHSRQLQDPGSATPRPGSTSSDLECASARIPC